MSDSVNPSKPPTLLEPLQRQAEFAANYAFAAIAPFLGQNARAAARFQELAVRAYRAGETRLALLCLNQAIHRAPQDSSLHCDLGQILYETGSYPQAEQSFRRAAGIEPGNLRAQKGLGFTLQASNDQSAVYVYLKYLEQDPDDFDVVYNLAVTLHNFGNYEEALKYYNRAAELDPDYALVPENQGRVLYLLGRDEEAIASLRKALAMNPKNPGAYRFIGLSLEALGEMEKAMENYREAIGLSPEDGLVQADVARLLSKTGKYAESVDSALIAIINVDAKTFPDVLVQTYGTLGWNYFRLDQVDKSLEASRRALGINPGLAWVRFNLGLALLCSGRKEEALAEYQKAADETTLASDLKYSAIDDLEKELSARPDLAGGPEIMSVLKTKYDALKSQRLSALDQAPR